MPVQKIIGKHIIPRYLYHITTKQNYKNMLLERTIKPAKDRHFGRGFFMFDLKNFMKNWTFDFGNYKNFDTRNVIFENIVRKQRKHKMVLLRIDTNKIKKEKLLIRSIKKLFQQYYGVENFSKRFPKEKLTNPDMKHIAQGDTGKMYPLYNQRKDAVEFAMRKKIDINCAEPIGEFYYKIGDNIYDILQKVFKDKNEKRAVEIYSPKK